VFALIGSLVACAAVSSVASSTTASSATTAVVARGSGATRSFSSTPTTVKKSHPVPILRLGSNGPAVLALQRRLSSLGYWLGQPNGFFGDSTQQAVYALQKVVSIERDGIVGPLTATALARGIRAHPRSRSGNVVEIDLHDDLLMIVEGGNLVAALNTSTGGGYTYYDGGVAAVADTPLGIFHVYRQVNGLVVDSLGELWRPKYFDSGFAIHGDSFVPPSPVSHGCVRVSNEAINWIWARNLLPIGTKVWIYS
jgi:peptidoglycan hydrolase-like protein with peptidoglycan-binding domain